MGRRNGEGERNAMPRRYAVIERFLGSEPGSYLLIHLEMSHAHFGMWLNASDDDPTRQIVAPRHLWSPTEIHIAAGNLTIDPKQMDRRSAQVIHREPHEHGSDEFIYCFDYS